MDINYYKRYEPFWGNWYIKKKIGSGSFGHVFEIERQEMGIVYKAALKVVTIPANEQERKNMINSEGMSIDEVTQYYRETAEYFYKECVVMSQLKGHTNIVGCEDHQIFQHANGMGWDIFIRMELLTPLREYLSNIQINEELVKTLAIDMCNALSLCSKKNIIHRDIKPENIFVNSYGAFKLGDFGVARTLESTTGASTRVGTYDYAAPEVFIGNKKYDSRVDIYSLGMVMYRLLNENRQPFLPLPPNNPTFNQREEAKARRMRGDKLPYPAHGGRLGDIILKACAYNAEDRFSSVEEMKRAIEQAYAVPTPVYREVTPAYHQPSSTPGYNGSSSYNQSSSASGYNGSSMYNQTTPMPAYNSNVSYNEAMSAGWNPQQNQYMSNYSENAPMGNKNGMNETVGIWGNNGISRGANAEYEYQFNNSYSNYNTNNYQVTEQMPRVDCPINNDKQKESKPFKAVFKTVAAFVIVILGVFIFKRIKAENDYYNGVRYFEGTEVNCDMNKAYDYFMKSAEGGKRDAMRYLGIMYYYGYGVDSIDYKKALTWLGKAADHGDAEAMYELGEMYFYGEGVKQKDYVKAMTWYGKAADHGNADAMYTLGWIYFTGNGVKQKDYVKAMTWFGKAADNGSATAMHALGYMYFYGVGVKERDYEKARYWLEKGADLGDEDCKELLNKIP